MRIWDMSTLREIRETNPYEKLRPSTLIGFSHIIVNVGLNFWLRNQNTQQGWFTWFFLLWRNFVIIKTQHLFLKSATAVATYFRWPEVYPYVYFTKKLKFSFEQPSPPLIFDYFHYKRKFADWKYESSRFSYCMKFKI